MKAILTLVLLTPLIVLAQEVPTRGEIYDFEIGDVFHYSYSSSSGQYGTATQHTIVGKNYSQEGDSVVYEIFENEMFYSADYMDGLYSEQSLTRTYHNLSQPIDSFPPNGIIDSVYTNELYNGRLTVASSEESQFDTYSQNTEFTHVNGLGLVYSYYHAHFFEFGTYSNSTLELRFFQKGTEVWGEPYSVFTGLQEITSVGVKIYPNPTSGVLTIQLENTNLSSLQVTLYDQLGKRVSESAYSVDGAQIDLSKLSTGMYIIHFDLDGKRYQSRIIKE